MNIAEFKNTVWDYTRKIEENMNSVFCPVIESHGLTMMQARILMELNQCQTHTIGSLAGSICVAGANISSMCKKLEGMGFLERARNKTDERVVHVILTSLGQETVIEMDKLFNERISLLLMNESEETFSDIILGLQKLNDLLRKMNTVEK